MTLNNVCKGQCYYQVDCKLHRGKGCFSFCTHHILLGKGPPHSVCRLTPVVNVELNDCLVPHDIPVVWCCVHAARLQMMLSMSSVPLFRVCCPQSISSYIQCLCSQGEPLATCGRCLGCLESCRLQTRQGGFVVRHAKWAASKGGEIFPWDSAGTSRISGSTSDSLPLHNHHHPHRPTAISFPKCSTPTENSIGGTAGCD